MIIDHTGEVWANSIPDSFALRLAGRIAFPIYAFMIAEGCRHTKNIKKYMLRLGAFALISEIPFDLCFENARISGLNDLTFLSFSYQNIFFNLFLAVSAIYIYELLKGKKYGFTGFLAFPAAMAAAELLNADYGAYAVPIIAALYFCKPSPDAAKDSGTGPGLYKIKAARAVIMIAGAAAIYLPDRESMVFLYGRVISIGIYAFLFACVPAVLVLFYNGRRGSGLKYFFYLMYPLHLLILAAAHIYMQLIT